MSPPRTVQAIRSLERPDSLSERIYADLRARLQAGQVAPDERLIDIDVAEACGTSRMPAREALLSWSARAIWCAPRAVSRCRP